MNTLPSGVTSLLEKPVPPVVMMQSEGGLFEVHHSMRVLCSIKQSSLIMEVGRISEMIALTLILSSSSGTMAYLEIVAKLDVIARSFNVRPDESRARPCEQRSLMVRIDKRILRRDMTGSGKVSFTGRNVS